MTGDQDDVAARFGHTRGDRPHADLSNELDVHARTRIGVLEVVDELLDIFDRIDVVVRRRTDQPDTRRGVPRLRDPGIDLVAGQLATFAGLGALSHLDLQVVRVDQVL